MSLTLAQASAILDATLKHARDTNCNPQTVVVLDAGGHLIAAKREDNSGILRYDIAFAKAYGALGMGFGSRTMSERATQNPAFFTALVGLSHGRIVPNAGGVLIRDGGGKVIGAVGISGDTADKDEACVVPAIAATGLKPDPGGTKT